MDRLQNGKALWPEGRREAQVIPCVSPYESEVYERRQEEDEFEKNFMEEGEEVMPTVGKKKFPYTKAGKVAAKKAAVKTGKPVKKKKGY